MNETLIGSLRESLVEGAAKDETTDQFQDRVRQNFGVSRSNALRIGRTEAGSAASGARQLAMEYGGVAETERTATRDIHCQPTRLAFDVARAKLGQPFANGCKFPLDRDAPASECCNCRCVSSPAAQSSIGTS